MLRKVAFGLLWLGFVVYAFFLAPPDQTDNFELIKNLSTGQWQGINPLVISLFNLMGIWPLIYCAVVFTDGRGQKLPAWLFAIASFGVGAFAMLPYLALRSENPGFMGKKNILIKVLDSRLTGVLLTLAASILVFFGLQGGNWQNFWQQWQTNRFIHVMSLDFLVLSLSFPSLLGDDIQRRDGKHQQFFWLFAAMPMFGPLIYLCIRPNLRESAPESGN